jgi:hypothetical protein
MAHFAFAPQRKKGLLQECQGRTRYLESPLAMCMREPSSEAREVLFPKGVARSLLKGQVLWLK